MIRDSIHTLKLPMFLNEKIVHCSQQIIALVNNDEYYKIPANWKKDTLNYIFWHNYLLHSMKNVAFEIFESYHLLNAQ